MLSNVTTVALVLSIAAFIIYAVEWAKDIYDRIKHPRVPPSPGKVAGQGDPGDTLDKAAGAAKGFKEAGPMYSSLAASLLFLLIAAIGSGLAQAAGR